MAQHTLTTSIRLAIPRERVFAFFSDAQNLARITPPELDFKILTPMPITMREGALLDYTIGLHGIPMRWRTLISKWTPNEEFVDEQIKGPYAQWIHRHTFRDDGVGGTLIGDEVQYRLPLAPLGDLAHFIVKMQLRRIFSHRTARVRELLGDSTPPSLSEAPRFA